ncbi:GDP-mannose 4,6-dehydratase [uncultured Maribacter sp.]|uniref:GDP-mannose 4,6-dehydratase n=1 Tax=uncultured Maribacter sp. TaxID=431308 RepID=UPI0030D9C9C6
MEEHSRGKVLITGINGFTGIHLESQLILLGYTVYGTTFSKTIRKNHFQCDILDKRQIKDILVSTKPNYIVHLAAISYVATENVSSIYETNILGTLNLLESLDELGLDVKKVLLASSAAVYGNIEGELSEDMCPKPVNHYGNSKLSMENMASNFFEKFNIIIVRPFNYTGIGQDKKFLIPKIVDYFKRKSKVIPLGNLHTFREYNDVNSFCSIYIELLNSTYCSDVVNVCSGRSYSIDNIIKMMIDISGHSLKVEVNPLYVRKNEISELKGSTRKLFQILGHPINYIDMKQTLASMFNN